MRQALKTVDNRPLKFVPSQDASLKEDATDIKDRPLVIMHRKLTREDRLNMRGLADLEERNGEVVVKNIGSVTRYIWENCVLEVLNVITDQGEFESLKGRQKDALFSTTGIDSEVMETVKHIQEVSGFSDAEAKNS
jgi:hypothetical protein